MPDHVELVRDLWAAFERGGIEAVLEIADPDVEWEPYGSSGTVYRGHDGLRAYMQWRADRNEDTEARLYTAFAKGDAVVARGEVRIRGEHGIVTMQPGWLYEFRNGKLIRFRGFASQEAAMRAAGLVRDDARSVVRELWDAFNRRDLERMMDLTAPDCDWRPIMGKQQYHGPEGVREYMEEIYGGTASAVAKEYAFQDVGDAVAVSGSLEVVDANGGIAQRQVHWLFHVRDGKVVRGQSFGRREQMIAAIEAHP